MRDYKNKIINVTKFVIVNLYFSNILSDDNSTLVKIFMKIHLIKNLKINMLIETDMFISQKFLLKCAFQFVIIFNYQNLKIFVKSIIKFYFQIKRMMKIKFIIILSFKLMMNVSINYASILFNDRDFLFEFEFSINYNFNSDDDIFIHVVDFIMIFIQTKNVMKTLIIFLKNVKLNIIIEYVANEYYQIFYKLIKLTIYE